MKRRWIYSLLTASLVAGMVGTSYADVKVSGGELRLRGIMVDNSESTAALKDGGFFEQRTRLNAEASADDNTKVFVQIQDSRTWGAEASTVSTGTEEEGLGTGAEALDVSQAYVDLLNVANKPLSLRIGRQAIAYGEHRLIGSLEWSNNARRFDAIKLTYKHSAADIDVFTSKISDSGADWGNDVNLNGIYASLKNVPQVSNLDLYLLHSVNDGQADANFYTLGGRVKGAVSNINIDYNAEIAIQSGDATSIADKSANAYAIRAGYTIPNVLGGLRIGVEYDAATGDSGGAAGSAGAAADGEDEAFSNLYPTNHYLYGYTDDVNWTNMNAWAISASMTPIDKLKVSIEYWNYALDQEVAGDDDNGTELNIKANHEMSKNVNCEAAYVIRDAGSAAGTASYGGYGTIPADESATFGYFMINVKFM